MFYGNSQLGSKAYGDVGGGNLYRQTVTDTISLAETFIRRSGLFIGLVFHEIMLLTEARENYLVRLISLVEGITVTDTVVKALNIFAQIIGNVASKAISGGIKMTSKIIGRINEL